MRAWMLPITVPALVLAACGGSSSRSHSAAKARSTLVYQATALAAGEPTGETIARAATIVRGRLSAIGVSGQVTPRGTEIVVALPAGSATAATERFLGSSAHLELYDWEANVITPSGRPAASLLGLRSIPALSLSQGLGSAAPGNPGAGSMSLYQAVKLASEQSSQASRDNGRAGIEYFMFGAPGSSACAAAARKEAQTPVPGLHCLLSGPSTSTRDLTSGLPSGVRPSQAEKLVVKRGTAVIKAVYPFNQGPSFSDPSAQFFVISDQIALSGSEIVNPRASTDLSGQPDVTFGFTKAGGQAFQRLTAEVARRANLASGLGQTLDQHFAVALDDDLITVPYVDDKQYPAGIPAGNGADIAGGFTVSSAAQLAAELRLGALPVALRLVFVTAG